ncbi:hypothetical protein [Paraburkholderia adhaesiva]|uniref:hypothetical protein n=1 Tax=Paraburkholderia adhaesiva TaxID=2883244 RepID=UPI001F39747C|nr:hypothetical protein [Paraburkholderia adhaesiva]
MSLSLTAVLQPLHGLVHRFAAARLATRRAVLSRLSFRAVERGALVSWLVRGAFSGRVRAVGVARYEAGRADVALTRRDALRTMSARVREAWIDERFYAAHERGRDPCPELRVFAAQIVARIREMRAREPKRPIILSPFHYLSQYANVCIVEHVRRGLGIESISLVSGVPRDVYGDDATMIPSIRVLHTYAESGEQRNSLGLRVVRALRREGVAVLFADVPPFTLAKFPMETVDVFLRGRHARVHAGVFRLGAPLDAYLLPFYLRLERGRFGMRMFEPIALAELDAPQRLADDIDIACKENYPHWLYAGHPCVYHFAPTR